MSVLCGIENLFKKEDAAKKISLSTPVNIPGYDAGRNGNLLVFQDDNLIIAYLEREKGLIFDKSAATVKPMICTAYIEETNQKDLNRLKKLCDADTDHDKVIVVNKKFMGFKFLNCHRRTLLEAQSAMSNAIGRVTVLEQATIAKYVEAVKNHWGMTVKYAFNECEKSLNKQAYDFAKAQKREIRHESGNLWQQNKVGHVNKK